MTLSGVSRNVISAGISTRAPVRLGVEQVNQRGLI